MDPERWQVIQDLFDQALERSSEDRGAFLHGAAAGDEDLRREVESLLASDAAAGEMLDDALSDGLELFFEGETEGPASGRFGKYDILEQIGQGGFGKVYRGHDPQLHRTVAIKTCTARDPNLRQRFVREARLAAGLQHPNIVTVHDFGEENGLPYLVQELLDGEDLNRRIERRESIPTSTARSYLLQIAQGLAYAHDRKVLHRDIKPENIRVLPGDRIKILDFGIACLVSEQRRLTGEHRTLGTVGYMAPEQLQGRDLDERSDIFAFGVLAYELVGLRRPFGGKAFADISHRILHEEPTPLRQLRPDIPESMAELVHRCLAKEPKERPDALRQVADELSEMDSRSAADVPQAVRWPLWVAAGSAAVAGGAVWALLVVSLPGRSSESPEPIRETPLMEIVAEETQPGEGADSRADLSAGVSKNGQPMPDVAATRASEPPPTASISPSGTTSPAASSEASNRQSGGKDGGEGGPGKKAREAPSEHGASSDTPSMEAPSDPLPVDPVEEAETSQDDVGHSVLDRPAFPRTQTGTPTPEAQLATQPMEGPPEPILVRRVEPTYPALARRRGVEGEVRVAVLVDASGGIRQTAVTFSSALDLGFEAAALEAARKATFQPAEMGGKTVQAWIELTYTFRLQ